jgi:hypothetical protein
MRRFHIKKFIRQSADRQIADNVSAHMSKGTYIIVGGKKIGPTDIVALFQQRAEATAEVDLKKADYQKALDAERATLDSTQDVAAALRQGLVVMFRDSPEILADLGLALPKKRKALKGTEIVAMAAKAKATRERHNGTAAAEPAPAPTAPPPEARSPAPIAPPVPDAPVVVNGAGTPH